MALKPSIRPTWELFWLLVAVAVTTAICLPSWYWARAHPDWELAFYRSLKVDRIERLFLGPEQIVCYVCFLWASFILVSRAWEVGRQRQAFRLALLPTDEGACILPEDARKLIRHMEQAVAGTPYILATMTRSGLGKYAVSRSAPDVAEVLRAQADVEQGRFVTSMGLVQYLAWAIPAIGFLGTVRGLAMAMSMANKTDQAFTAFMEQATGHLGIAFDCTLVALGLSVFLMYLLHVVQRAEENLVIDCQQYCQEHLLLRLYNPQAEPALAE
jgi:biopolymer transport protein ExbB/TolQ